MKTKILVFVTFLTLVFFASCNNESVDETAVSSKIISDEVVADVEIDATVDDVSSIAEDQFLVQQSLIGKTSAPVKSMLPACATVTTTLTNDIFTKTIDFGTAGCTLPNGNSVKGKIIIRFSKNFLTPSRTISYTLEGFYHNGKLTEGNKTISHELKSTTLLTTLHPVTTHSIDMKITFADGKVYTRTGTRVREMVEGFETFGNWEDNVFNVWGNHSTIFPNGSTHTSTIKTPLVIKMSCKMPFPVSGAVENVKNDSKATLDYGNGDCDKLATVTINGVAKEIILGKK
jgi:hypothetical protein